MDRNRRTARGRNLRQDTRAADGDHPHEHGDNTATYDGRNGWIAAPLRRRRVAARRSGTRGCEARCHDVVSLAAQAGRGEMARRCRLDNHDKDVDVVQGNTPTGIIVTLSFDQQSGLLTRSLLHGFARGKIPCRSTTRTIATSPASKCLQFTMTWLNGRDRSRCLRCVQTSRYRCREVCQAGAVDTAPARWAVEGNLHAHSQLPRRPTSRQGFLGGWELEVGN